MARFRFQAELSEDDFMTIEPELKEAKFRSVYTLKAVKEKLTRDEGNNRKARVARIARDAELLRPVLEALGVVVKS